MAFNVSTFALEIINFLILIWILQRLFYKPLLNIIAKRKQFIDESLDAAQVLQQQADAQKQQYLQRLQQWEQEQQAARDTLQQEIDSERKQRLTQLNTEFEQERQKLTLALNKQQQELQLQQQKQALLNGARFATLLLQQAVTPALETKLGNMLLTHLTELPATCLHSLATAGNKKALSVKISSVYPLDAELQQQLELKLSTLIPYPTNFHYSQNPALLAGLQIDLGHWMLDANVQHELTGFADIAHASV